VAQTDFNVSGDHASGGGYDDELISPARPSFDLRRRREYLPAARAVASFEAGLFLHGGDGIDLIIGHRQ
jgi:hypothetical protein